VESSRLSAISFHSWVQTLPPQEQAALLDLFPQGVAKSHPTIPRVVPEAFFSDLLDRFIDHVHPSWLQLLLAKYTSHDQELLIQAFDFQKSELSVRLNHSTSFDTLSPLAKSYIREKFYFLLIHLDGPADPLYAVESDPLFPLLSLHAERFEEFFTLLSLYDIQDELGTLIHAEKLKAIHEQFPPYQRDFLKKIGKQSAVLSSAPLGLQYWNGKNESLKSLLTLRGMNRLAKALASRPYTLKWHLYLLLGVEQAKILKRFQPHAIDSKVENLLLNQVLEAYAFFPFQQEE
jgi:hypothetical protein